MNKGVIRKVWMDLPKGYPDEILLSIVQRWQARNWVPNWHVASRFLLGKYTTSMLKLPKYLTELSLKSSLSINEIVKHHTMYPFYAAFYQEKSESYDSTYFYEIIRKAANRALSLSLCPACVVDDFEVYGEPYWHRVHQIPNVAVCPKHNVWIMRQCPECSEPLQLIVHAAGALVPTRCRNGHYLLKPKYNCDSKLVLIAEACQLLLNLKLSVNVDKLKQFYFGLGIEYAERHRFDGVRLALDNPVYKLSKTLEEYLWIGGFLEKKTIEAERNFAIQLSEYFGEGIFKQIQVENPLINPFGWTYGLFSGGNSSEVLPIHHILIGIYLFGDFLSFINELEGFRANAVFGLLEAAAGIDTSK